MNLHWGIIGDITTGTRDRIPVGITPTITECGRGLLLTNTQRPIYPPYCTHCRLRFTLLQTSVVNNIFRLAIGTGYYGEI